MEFRILGPLEAIGPDGPLVLRGAKRRGLLAFMLVHRGQVLSSVRRTLRARKAATRRVAAELRSIVLVSFLRAEIL